MQVRKLCFVHAKTLTTVEDIVERFTITTMLVIIAFRNFVELYGSEFDFSEGVILPKSFGWFRGSNFLSTILYVCYIHYILYSN